MTLEQRGFYWAAVLPAAAEGMSSIRGIALTPAWMHEEYKTEFLMQPIVDVTTGEVTGEEPGSTEDLSAREMAEYIDKIAASFKRHGIEMPDPRQYRRVAAGVVL